MKITVTFEHSELMNTVDIFDIDGSIAPKAIEAFNHETEYKYNNLSLKTSNSKIELNIAPVVYNWIAGKVSSIVGIYIGAYKSVLAIIKAMLGIEMNVFFGDELVIMKDGKVVEKKDESSYEDSGPDDKCKVFNM